MSPSTFFIFSLIQLNLVFSNQERCSSFECVKERAHNYARSIAPTYSHPYFKLPDQRPHLLSRYIETHSSNCILSTICEDVSDYPYDHIESVLGQFHARGHLTIDNPATKKKRDLSGDLPTSLDFSTPICGSKLDTIFPKTAKNTGGEWKYIVTSDVDNKNGVVMERCLKPEQPCDESMEYINPPAICRQKFKPYKMLTISNDGNFTVEFDNFMLPSDCACLKPTKK